MLKPTIPDDVEYRLSVAEMTCVDQAQQIVELRAGLVQHRGLDSWTYDLYRLVVLRDGAMGLASRAKMAEWLAQTELEIQVQGGLDLLADRIKKREEWSEFRTRLLKEFWQ